ncbi:polysaccharide deacetylase family protein [Streptomyces sp. LP05-1]|uniref:Polysaccharide deacetylase family protein n=1 Tax=Streptomyces pyxinae TaxID=2970734 RepID=A0ABT2CJE7_9ACTN|nr:polysaccharide deacetylase family protein [Streptomyces sp. LP05-1]MCS0637537.1 polysaccharide deacetylase family protein [Streptomyces sp. LP05-1]
MVWSKAGGAYSRVLAAVTGAAFLTAAATGCGTRPGDTGPAPAAPGSPGKPSAQAGIRPIPGQTSRPDASLPAPLVSMDLSHDSDKGARGVNITIDDGPDPVWTPRVLRLLKDNGVKATFCMVGPQAEAHPGLVKDVVAAGHLLCAHSLSHDTAMDHKSRDYQAKEVLESARMITEASGGVKPLYYRAPGGAFTPYSRQLAAAHGMRPLGWNVDSKDFKRPGSAAIVRTVKNELSNGPTVLFHDAGGDRSQTVAALREILPWLKHQGREFGFPER